MDKKEDSVRQNWGKILFLTAILSGCSGENALFSGGSAGTGETSRSEEQRQSTIWDLFENRDDPNTTIAVNKYLWTASLEVLDFLPLEQADPFSGIIVTGFGTPPGGGQSYRATVLVQDPALDARSLSLSLATRTGPASDATIRAVEDAILTRARQLRIRDMNL